MAPRRATHAASPARFALVALTGAIAGAALIGLPTGPLVGTVLAAPQPDVVPRRWEMQLEPGDLRATVVNTQDGPVRVFYLTYTVANLTNEDLYLAPLFELATDDGDLVRSGRGVPAEVYAELLRRLRNPLLEDEIAIQGPLRQGREHTKHGLVVWLLPATDMDEVSVYAAGFSGETRAIERPDTGEKVILRKSRMLRHPVPGELDPAMSPTLRRTEDQWIMR